MLDQAALSFNHIMGEQSQTNTTKMVTISGPIRSEEPQLYIHVKEENENLKVRVE